ncbi:MAG: type II secretion system protein [Halobacteria archaeon]|nr:type II secretion system protein [Halobacteria archaeon]
MANRRQSGFTLLEMIIALVVVGLLGAAAGYSLVGGTLAFSGTADAVQTLGKLRHASERMAREVREIRRDPVTPAVYDITTMNTTTLAFTKTDGTTVTLTGSPPLATLAYSAPAGTHTLTDEVGSLAFNYLQADGSTAATGNGDVAFVELELVLTRSGNSYPQRVRVSLRNRQ